MVRCELPLEDEGKTGNLKDVMPGPFAAEIAGFTTGAYWRSRPPQSLHQVLDDGSARGVGVGLRQRTLSILQNNSERKAFFLI
jgi:hypothetical protein